VADCEFHAANQQSRYVCFRMNLAVVGLGGVSSDSVCGGAETTNKVVL